MSACEHPAIRVMFSDETPVMWACANRDCSLRFYPACPKCVTVGHRDGHVDVTFAATSEPWVEAGPHEPETPAALSREPSL